jgi:hypothetical protein
LGELALFVDEPVGSRVPPRQERDEYEPDPRSSGTQETGREPAEGCLSLRTPPAAVSRGLRKTPVLRSLDMTGLMRVLSIAQQAASSEKEKGPSTGSAGLTMRGEGVVLSPLLRYLQVAEDVARAAGRYATTSEPAEGDVSRQRDMCVKQAHQGIAGAEGGQGLDHRV